MIALRLACARTAGKARIAANFGTNETFGTTKVGVRILSLTATPRHGLVRSTSLEAAKEFLSGQVESMSIWPFCKRLRSVGRERFAQCVLGASSYLEGNPRCPLRR